MKAKCPHCGKEIDAKSSFCGKCGKKLKQTIIGTPTPISDPNLFKKNSSAKFSRIKSKKLEDLSASDTLFNSPDILLGKMVGEYKVTNIIGKGGMGWVFSGIHPVIEKKVAIKVLKSKYSKDEKIVSSFMNEAKAVNSIGSKKIIDIFAFGQLESGNFYFIMELLEGSSLAEFLKKKGKLKAYDAYKIITPILDALQAAHDKKIIHRDLKPENIYICKDEDKEYTVKLLDFGIAKFKEDSFSSMHETQAGVIKGSPLYMSPEQCKGEEITVQSDIYSFGIILYKIFTGKVPFRGKNALSVITAHLKDEPEPPSKHADIPKELDNIILNCLKKDPQERIASILDLKDMLIPVLQNMALAPVKKKNRSGILVFLLACLVVAGSIFFVLKPWKYWNKNKNKNSAVFETVELSIISAHPTLLNQEFEAGFNKWMLKNYKKQVKIKWFSFRDELASLQTNIKSSIKNNKLTKYDVIFGGGEQIHHRLASPKCLTIDGKNYRCSEIINLEQEIKDKIPSSLHGVKLYDEKGYWYGTALSGFGFFCHKGRLKQAGLELPETWKELAKPQFFQKLISADPSKSSSTYMIYEIIMQSMGWERGLKTIISLGANIHGDFLKSSKIVLHKLLDNKKAVCGLSIDFLFHMQNSQLDDNIAKQMKFILPEKTAVFTSDPISIVKNARHLFLAEKFIKYVLTEGQFLFIKPVGHPKGPEQEILPRLPIVPDLYKESEPVNFYVNPFTQKSKLQFDSKQSLKRKKLFRLLLKAALIESHKPQVNSWDYMIKNKKLKIWQKDKNIVISKKTFNKKLKGAENMNRLAWNELQFKWIEMFHKYYKNLRGTK
ncbi:MAG: protein kinase domain-containing protein [Myxococcota bacterium]